MIFFSKYVKSRKFGREMFNSLKNKGIKSKIQEDLQSMIHSPLQALLLSPGEGKTAWSLAKVTSREPPLRPSEVHLPS